MKFMYGLDLAHLVADDFIKTMDEEKFETFTEMKECYWWTSQDIKEEVMYFVNTEVFPNDCVMADDGEIINTSHVENMSYRKFMNLVYKVLKNKNRY